MEKCTIQSDPSEYRWFWNPSQDPWDKSKIHLWTQYDLDISDKIEKSFLNRRSEHELNDMYIIKFDYKTQQHLQMHKENQWKQRPVIRQKPKEVKNIIRLDRIQVTENEMINIYENNFIDQIQLFCYSKIFLNFQIDKSDPFIRDFTSYCTLLDRKLVHFFENEYVSYLQQVHHLKCFNFTQLKDILSKDLKRHKKKHSLFLYVNYYVKQITQENFNSLIIKMYTEEGPLYKNLNKVIRNMSLNQHMEYAFFFLCFLYVLGSPENKIAQDLTVFRGLSIPREFYTKFKNAYQVDKIIINYDFMSTSKKREVASQIMKYKNTLHKKIFFEISIEKESSTTSHLSFKPYDITTISTHPDEEEIIIPPNGVFQVSGFFEEGNGCDYVTVKLKYQTNLFSDSLPFILKDSQLAHQFGFYKSDSLITEDDFQQVISFIGGNKEIDLLKLSKMINLRNLDLSNAEIGDEGMKVFASQLIHLNKLQQLDLSENEIGDKGMKVFASQLIHLNQLQEVNLEKNRIGVRGIKAFASQLIHLNKLQRLNLSWNKLGNEGVKALASQVRYLTQLEELDISNNNIGDESMNDWGLIYLNQLERKLLSMNKVGEETKNNYLKLKIQDKSWISLDHPQFIRNVESFHHAKKELFTLQFTEKLNYFAGNSVKITKQEFWCIKTFQYYQNVQKMDLSCNKIGDEEMKAFASQLIHLNQIQHLDLSENEIGDIGMNAFSLELINLNQLQELNFRKNKIGDKGITIFAFHSLYLVDLQHLLLNNNQIGDEGMKAFASNLIHLTRLQQLDLSWNEIGDDGMKAFASQLIHLTQIKRLDLSWNEIGEEGMKEFASQLLHLIHIQQLDLSKNKIGDEAMNAFASQLIQLNQQIDLSCVEISDEELSKTKDLFSMYFFYCVHFISKF